MHTAHVVVHLLDRHAAWLLATLSSVSIAFGLGWSLLALVHPII